ncbi:hypothetical protein RAS1_10820 [Phycisphaerae bacterium RAS1]|nr:hypothetical protein RAS1_10820 [Phycisphaerae bacterium RAS1]
MRLNCWRSYSCPSMSIFSCFRGRHADEPPVAPSATGTGAIGEGATGGLPASANVKLPPNASRISALLYAIKRPFSYRVRRALLAVRDPLLSSLTTRERPGKEVFRFWQEGPGYDRNIYSWQAVQATIDYIHLNPCRRGLCERPEEWRWSSFREYEQPVRPFDAALPRITPLEF